MAKNTRTSSTKKSAASTATQDDHSLLHDLFLDELRDIYWAEKHLTKALPKFRKATTNEELAAAFETHLGETEEQIARLEEVFEMMEVPARAKKMRRNGGFSKGRTTNDRRNSKRNIYTRCSSYYICAKSRTL
jgi:hypothetical protein